MHPLFSILSLMDGADLAVLGLLKHIHEICENLSTFTFANVVHPNISLSFFEKFHIWWNQL